jgi:hypothetical protein
MMTGESFYFITMPRRKAAVKRIAWLNLLVLRCFVKQ